ncbi:hypothetical protein NZ698_16875 [Chryseobacterium sp. PBS4-4]|uniref:DUF4397 domain-containing protein n=1 Tax=Chryseobacterium edaphi TaxID=2976532 RepID=A0ABT2W9J1_9FLAO|nr:hypothetical protein [Chryseobacterium edaphi]MCU7618856.1 hypothetical protein [Chryseobacterium edaphi]
MIRPKVLILAIVFFGINMFTGQVGINIQSPDASSALDITSPNRGVLIPQYSLASLSDTSSPVASPAEGSIIYNTGGAFPKGNYYWTGVQWERLSVNTEYDQILKVEKKGSAVAIASGANASSIISFDATGIINTISGVTFSGGSDISLPAGTYKIDVSFDGACPTSGNSTAFVSGNHLYVISAVIEDNAATPNLLTDEKVSSIVSGVGTINGGIQGYRYSFVLTLAATTVVRLRLRHNNGASNSSATNVGNAGIVASFYKFL